MLTDSTTGASKSFYSSSTLSKGKMIYRVNSCLPYGYARCHFLSDYEKSPSMECTLMTEHKCWISFTVVGGETETTAYNLQIYGKVHYSVWLGLVTVWVSSLRLSCPRLSRSSPNPNDYSGCFPLHRVHWPDSACCVEGTGVSPRP